MSDPLIRKLDDYVILEPGEKEKFLSAQETLKWLAQWLATLKELPQDLQEKQTLECAAQHLLDTACELEVKRGVSIQWFAVRLDHED